MDALDRYRTHCPTCEEPWSEHPLGGGCPDGSTARPKSRSELAHGQLRVREERWCEGCARWIEASELVFGHNHGSHR